MFAFIRSMHLSVLVSLLGLVWNSGYGKAADAYDGPRGDVEETIMFEGEPVPEGSTVMFQSAEGMTYVGTSLVKSHGKYKLKSAAGRKLPAMLYKVQVSPPPIMDDTAPDPATADPSEMTPEKVAARAKAFAAANTPPFPAKYGSIHTRGLTFQVE